MGPMDTLRKILEKSNIDAEIAYDEPLSSHCSFRIGGPADVFARPRSAGALAGLLALARERGIPAAILGGGANVLVGDRGVRGLVVCTSLLGGIRVGPDGQTLSADAGAAVTALVARARDEGLSGLEFAAGLPGSVGGAVYMNARCYEREFADLLESVEYLSPDLVPGRITIAREEWEYKRTPFMPGGALAGATITGASFRLAPGLRDAMTARMRELEADRREKGHFDYPCAGSLFKNDRAFGRPTGKILDELGFRGRRVGGAMVSPKHANIFVNAGGASAADMRALIAEAQTAAREAYGFELVPEVVFLGDF